MHTLCSLHAASLLSECQPISPQFDPETPFPRKIWEVFVELLFFKKAVVNDPSVISQNAILVSLQQPYLEGRDKPCQCSHTQRP